VTWPNALLGVGCCDSPADRLLLFQEQPSREFDLKQAAERPAQNAQPSTEKSRPQSIPITFKESRSSNSSINAFGTGGNPARSAMLDVSYRARTLSSTPT